MNFGKATGNDRIPAELYRALSEESLKAFHEDLASIWEGKEMPFELFDATIIALYRKGTRADCRN